MGYVNLVDYDKKIGGGFTARPHFKKWYKKGFLGNLDFMMVNGRVAWNMSCDIQGIIRTKLNNRMWRVCVADLMLQWRDPQEPVQNNSKSVGFQVRHEQQHLTKEWRGKHPRCWVCGFETSMRNGLKVTVEGCTDARCKKNMVQCSNPTCDIIAHSHMDGENKRFIFDIPCFVGKTCFDIAHDNRFRGMFVENNNAESRQKRTARRGHRLYKQI